MERSSLVALGRGLVFFILVSLDFSRRSRPGPNQIRAFWNASACETAVRLPAPPGSRHFTAVINAIRSHRIQNKMIIVGELIAKWLAVHEIKRRIFEELGHKVLKCLRVSTVPRSVTLERKSRD